MKAKPDPRYAPTLRRLHWLMAALVLAAYLLMEQRDIFPRGSAGRGGMMQGHFWAGILVFWLAWWRLARRRVDGAPPITPAPGRNVALASRATHLALYAFFLVMPVLGLATAWSDGKAVLIPFTGIALTILTL